MRFRECDVCGFSEPEPSAMAFLVVGPESFDACPRCVDLIAAQVDALRHEQRGRTYRPTFGRSVSQHSEPNP